MAAQHGRTPAPCRSRISCRSCPIRRATPKGVAWPSTSTLCVLPLTRRVNAMASFSCNT
jgi:hypothetical protein